MKSSSPTPAQSFTVNVIILIAFLAAFWLLFILRDLAILFLISCFFALLIWPFVAKLRRWGCPDILAICLTFFGVFLAVVLFVASIIPLFVGLAEDSKTFIVHSITSLEQQARTGFPMFNHLPLNMDVMIRSKIDTSSLAAFITDGNRTQVIVNRLIGDIDTIKNLVQSWAGQVTSVSLSFASLLTSAFAQISLVTIITFLIILERRIFLNWFFTILPTHLGHYFRRRQHTISNAIHDWLRGQMIMVWGMFLLTFIGLFIAQYFGLPVEHIFSLALIAGMMEFVPYLGPIIAFLPAFLVVLFSPETSMLAVWGITVLYIILQQIEWTFLYTFVMSQTLRLSSLYILLFTIIGATLGWALGIILAIPLASILHIFYHDWMHYRNTPSE